MTASGLTGIWDGLFSYPRRFGPVPFTAVLLELGSHLSGSIHEQPKDGRFAGLTLKSAIEGGRSGSRVRFIKTYDAAAGTQRRPITYEGLLNTSATEIEGQWSISSTWSGKFLMVRSSSQAGAARAERKVAVPVT